MGKRGASCRDAADDCPMDKGSPLFVIEDMLADVGFTNVQFHTLDHDVQNFFAVATKDR